MHRFKRLRVRERNSRIQIDPHCTEEVMGQRQSTDQHFTAACNFSMLRVVFKVRAPFQQLTNQFDEFVFNFDNGNEDEQEVVHEAHVVPVPAHRCHDWIE
jgi:hypothetical protein